MSRLRRVADRRELERSVDEYITRGYRITSQGESSTRLKEKDWGEAGIHFIIAVLTIWWTFGLANTLYALYKRVTAEEIVIRIEDTDRVSRTTADEDTPFTDGTVGNERTRETTTPGTDWSLPLRAGFQLFSLIVAAFVLVSMFLIHTGLIGLDYLLLTLITLGSAVLFRYVAVQHRFARPGYKTVVLVLGTVAVVVSGFVAGRQLIRDVTVTDVQQVLQSELIGTQLNGFLSEGWIAVILVPAGALLFFGSLVRTDMGPYPKPTEIREVVLSPVYFGFVCAFLGLWAVLFVGISIQRIIVIAPIFEELLKFGVALLVGSALFDRSLAARIGVAAVVGAVFGLVEHATTYPTEEDLLYLFRTLFHMMTTVLSVATYSLFESESTVRFRWYSPLLSTLIHFFYNTFAVLSGVFAVVVLGSQSVAVTVFYGGVAILLLTGLLGLALVRYRIFRLVYVPLDNVLSDLV